MNPKELEAMCLDQIAKGSSKVTLSFPKGTRMPAGFPRGELLSENQQFTNRSVKPEKLLRWLREQMLIESRSKERHTQ